MSVSSHLTPEPERRLWLILDHMRGSVERTEAKIGALTLFAAGELACIALTRPAGLAGKMGLALLGAALPLGVFTFAPLTSVPKRLGLLEPAPGDKSPLSENLLAPEDVARYTYAEAIARLDKYLGGGITAQRYYEDLVAQIVLEARLATRKRRLFGAACLLVLLGQLGFLGHWAGL